MSWLENAAPTSVGQGLWLALSTLKTSSTTSTYRTVRTSSTGSGGVYAQAGDVIVEASLSNALAWFVLRGRPFKDAGTTYYREWCLQVDGSGGVRLTYSPRLGFVAGSPSTTRAPAAADQRPVLGAGTEASPTFESPFPASGHRWQGWASESDDRFFFLAYPVGGGPAAFLWFLDLPSTPPALDSGQLADPDSAVQFILSGANSALDLGLATESSAPRSSFAYGDAVKSLWGRCAVRAGYVRDQGGTLRRVYPAGASTSLLWGPTPSYPEEAFRYVRRAGLAGTLLPGEAGNANTTDEKGTSSTFRWAGREYSMPELLDALDPVTGLAASGTVLAVGHALLPWSGTALSL